MLKLFLVCVLSLTAVLAEDPPFPFAEEDHVKFIGEPTWQKAITQFPEGFLMYYYEEYCLPCREFFPKYVQAAKNLFDLGSKVAFGKIDCHDEVKTCDEKGVTSFPTLMLYIKDHEPFEYRGPKTTEDLQAWIRRLVDNTYETIDDEETLFKNHTTAVVVKDWNLAVFEAYKTLHDDIAVAIAGPNLRPSFLGENFVAIATQTGQRNNYFWDISVARIIENVRDLHNRNVALPNLNHQMIDKLKGPEDYDVVLFFRTNAYKSSSTEASTFHEVSQKFGDEDLPFAFVNIDNDIFGEHIARYFGLTRDSRPSVGIISKKGRVLRKYLLQGEITQDNLVNFIKKFSRGEQERYYMSAEIPQPKQNNYVRELVGKNYKQVTQDPSLNVLVMTYFPYCEWCIKLDPTWDSLAYRFRNRKDLVLAKIDVSKNDLEGIDATEHPILLFYPSGSPKKMVEYQSNRNVRDILKFLVDNVKGLAEDIEL